MEDLSAPAKQIDQWFSKLVSLVPRKIYAPSNNVSTPLDNVKPSSNVKRNKRKNPKSKGNNKKIDKKMKEKSQNKTLTGTKPSTVEQQASNATVAASEEKPGVSDAPSPLDAKLHTILAKTRGEKVVDDEKVLKRRWKEKERRKRKSKRDWGERKKAEEERQKIRQQMSEQNIQKRKMKRKAKTKKSR
ncbi:hypothetical protein Gasu2_21840 [Galdieria sulphuraria]|nr:hypothetical protein Gasu2_21840 [Galdieria sulphuraria]